MIKFALTGGMSSRIVSITNEILNNKHRLDYIFIQTNSYRYKREKDKLKKNFTKYFITFCERFLFLKILKLPITFSDFIIGRFNDIKKNRFDHRYYQNISNQEIDGDYIHVHRCLKKIIVNNNARTKVIILNDINSANLSKYDFDYLFVIGGAILNNKAIRSAKKNCFVAHNTFLPKLRGYGGGEIWAAINNDFNALGFSIIKGTDSVDGGDILLQKNLQLKKNESFDDLIVRNFNLGTKLILEAFNILKSNKITLKKQNSSKATFIQGHPTREEYKLGIANFKKALNKL